MAALLLATGLGLAWRLLADRPADLGLAAETGDVATVRRLLRAGAKVDARNAEGRTALQAAAFGGQVETLRLLLEKGADLNAKDRSNQTAVMLAVSMGRLESARLLLEKGADANSRDASGETLHDDAAFAARRRHQCESRPRLEPSAGGGRKRPGRGDAVPPGTRRRDRCERRRWPHRADERRPGGRDRGGPTAPGKRGRW